MQTDPEPIEDDEHFPWSYTEFGTLCICGGAMDANERYTRQKR